jgi:hypothetical protein
MKNLSGASNINNVYVPFYYLKLRLIQEESNEDEKGAMI